MLVKCCLYGSDPALPAGLDTFAEISPQCEKSLMRGGPAHQSEISLLRTSDLAKVGGKKINVHMHPRSSNLRRARKYPCKSEVKSSPLTRASSPPYKHPLKVKGRRCGTPKSNHMIWLPKMGLQSLKLNQSLGILESSVHTLSNKKK